MKINLWIIALALTISCLFPASAARAGNSPGLTLHDAAFSSGAQASRPSKRLRHTRAVRKSARRSRRHSSASQPTQSVHGTSNDIEANRRTDIQPALRDDAEENGRTPGPTPTPSLEQQFPKTYKVKKP